MVICLSTESQSLKTITEFVRVVCKTPMGCWHSSLSSKDPTSDHRHVHTHKPPRFSNGTTAAAPAVSDGGVPAFSEFSLAELKTATNNFSSEFIVSESGEKAPNVVYKGRLQNRRWIAVKKFTKLAWPDPKQFAVFYALYFWFNFFCFLLNYVWYGEKCIFRHCFAW